MIRAIAIDDEPPALAVLQHYCAQTAGVSLLGAYTSVKAAQAFLGENEVDLIFLDIHMPSVSGLELARSFGSGLPVIFTTAHSEYAIEGFNLNAVDYLLKPYTLERFAQAIEKVATLLQARGSVGISGHLLLRVEYALVRVELNEIVSVEGLDDYVRIHLAGQRPLLVRMTMKAMEEKLPAAHFIRVHRSWIVSLPRISAVRNKTVHVGEFQVPIGSRYEEAFFERYR